MNLVTGATGLVGSYLCRYLLLKGEAVRALKRKSSDLSLLHDIKEKIEWVEGDITDVISLDDAMEGIDRVYHVAAAISFAKNKRRELMKVNVDGTANVVNIALEKKIKKLVHVSSSATLSINPVNPVITEKIIWQNAKHVSDYSISKYLAEQEVWRAIAEGLHAVIINPTIITGAGNWNQGSCKMFATIGKGFRFYTTGTRGYVDVRDVVKIAWQLMHSNIEKEKFIVNSENIIFRDYFFMIADALQRKRPAVRANAFLSGLTWRVYALRYLITGKEPSVTKQTARIANSTFYFDNSKIRQALQYDFIPVKKSVEDTAIHFLHYGKTGKFGHTDF